jgi:hypothetical protein
MNRAARRRAAALNRKRRTGYMGRILDAIGNGALEPTPDVTFAAIEHDPDCGLYRGCGCDCTPGISISGPDGVVVIDEDGGGTKRTRQSRARSGRLPPPPSKNAVGRRTRNASPAIAHGRPGASAAIASCSTIR